MSEPDTRFDSEQRDNAHPPGVEAIYWHRARNRILFRKLSKHLGPADSVLEVGCGPGVVVAYLRERGVACTGVDLAAQANIVPAARKHVEGGVDAFDLPQQRRAAVSALLLLDVLEHLPAPGDFLARCENRFPALRTILITLPARPEVWSTYDDYYGHYARYTLESLPQLGVPSSFRLLDCGYFFHGLYWAARAQRLLTTARSIKVTAPAFPVLHDLVGRLFDWEERLGRPAAPGTSLYAVYGRPGA